MKHTMFSRVTAVSLSLLLLTAPCAQALTLEQAGELLEMIYVDEIPSSVWEQSTIPAMLDALGDPYTQYFTAEEYADFTASMSDTALVGIGVTYTLSEEGLLLKAVTKDSPAEKGGLQPGDIIVEVDGQSVNGEDGDAVAAGIRGEEGTKVRITYLRQGIRKTVTLTRTLVVVPATTTELIDGHIGYISCSTFGGETVSHFQEGIEAYEKDASVWIVDLRSNSGGVTEAAVGAAGCFIGSGEMAYLRDGSGTYSAYYHEEEALTDKPVIVLMDYNSASASEIFASAIRDRGAGIVVGTRSYGKGVAQSVLDQDYLPEYFPDGDAIKITSHRFYTPNGVSTDQVGVVPTFLVEEDMTGNVAYLLSGAAPTTDTSGTLRLDWHGQWFIDMATAAEYPEAFQALLEAIPQGIYLDMGTGGANGWREIDAAQAAEACGLEYQAPVFPDHSDSNFNIPVSLLKTYDMLHGKEDGKFHPKDTLTRAELCQLLAVALNCMVPENASPYSDVSDDAWYAPAIIAMTNMGMVNGFGDDTFHPEEPVDHQQLITIMGRLATKLNMYLYDDAQEIPKGALEAEELAGYDSWARPSLWLLACSQKGYFGNTFSLLWDTTEHIAPNEATTRDEAASLLCQLLSYSGVLPNL